VIVLDASAAVDLLLITARGPHVARALAGLVEAHVPELFEAEVLAVLRRWLLRG
jgi:predicted nucleic acid-binding protein